MNGAGLLVLAGLLTGCYAMDSATSACQRTPAYCASVVGEETVVPVVRGGAEVASLAGVHRLLTPDTQARLEQALVDCAESADAEVNRLRLGGHAPSRPQCQELLPRLDPCGRKVTRAMQLGTEKHQLALQCAEGRLDALMPGRFSLEPRYRYEWRQRRTQLISEPEARALLRSGCGEELKGTLRPDVVIHSGNPLEVAAIYDFKFPCPSSNRPVWSHHPDEHLDVTKNQGEAYVQALKAGAALVAPRWGVVERLNP